MKSTLASLAASFLVASLPLTAQGYGTDPGTVLQCAVFNVASGSAVELPTTPNWLTEVPPFSPHKFGAFQLTSNQGGASTVTMLLAFAVPDPDFHTNLQTLEVLRTVYPFLNHPVDMWKASDIGSIPGVSFSCDNAASHAVVIPPARIHAVLQNLNLCSGPTGSAGGIYQRPNPWTSLSPGDERHVLAGSTWDNHRVLDVSEIGRHALDVAATKSIPGATAGARSALHQLIQNTYNWVIHVQALHVTPPQQGGPVRLQLSQPLKISTRSLAATENPTWLNLMGPDRSLPSLLFENPIQYFEAAGLGEFLILDVPGGLGTDVFAHVPIPGGFVTLPRLQYHPVTLTDLMALKDEKAVFYCPSNAVHGTGYVTNGLGDPIRLPRALLNTWECGFAMYVFLPPAPLY